MVAAIWLCVVSMFSRSPNAGVSGPITAIQTNSAPGTLLPWSVQSPRVEPRPWSVVTTSAVLSRYCGELLEHLPRLGEELIRLVGRIEVEIVAPSVPPFVGLAQADVEHARLSPLQRRPGRSHREYIERIVRPVTRDHRHEFVQVALAVGERIALYQFPPRVHGQTAFARPKDEREHVPGTRGLDAASETRPVIQVLQHGQIRVVPLGVRVDARIAETAEHLVIAGVGKLQTVGAADASLAGGVAEQLSLFGDGSPQKRHQSFPASGRRTAPVAALEAGQITNTAPFGIEERFVRTREHFLPTKAVQRDDEDILRFRMRLDARCRAGKEDQKQERGKKPLS